MDGYHELEMVMSSVDLADRLIFEEIPENKILIETNKAFLPIDKRNNVYQAASIIKQRYGITKGLKISIEKNIPVAAGLGGGSSDCAAALAKRPCGPGEASRDDRKYLLFWLKVSAMFLHRLDHVTLVHCRILKFVSLYCIKIFFIIRSLPKLDTGCLGIIFL